MYKIKTKFLYLEIAEIDMGVNSGSQRTIFDIKTPGVNGRI